MRVLVTGGDGFVGNSVVWGLARSGDTVFATDLGLHRPLPQGATFVSHDIALDPPDALARLAPDCIVHCAGLFGTEDANALHTVNVLGTEAVVQMAIANSVGSFVFVSSGAVYGPARTPRSETDALAPADAYALSKVRAEARVAERLDAHTMRLYFPVGVGQVKGLVPRLVEVVASGHDVRVRPRRGPVLSICDVQDVVHAILAAAHGEIPRGVYNVCPERALDVREIVEVIAAALNSKPRFSEDADLAGDWIGCGAKLKRDLPNWDYSDPVAAIRKYVDSVRGQLVQTPE